MITHGRIAQQPDAVDRCSETLEALHRRIARRFARSETRNRAWHYLLGLLGRVERKNGWQLAEAIGEDEPLGVQRFLNSAKWDAEAVRDDLREYVVEHLADEESGVLIADETGFLKKGEKSVGVARQYTGTAGDTVNCQVGVFVAYASKEGASFIDRALYLPREWTDDAERKAEAGVPEEIVFEDKIELAKGMLERAFAAEVPARWVVADSFYGRSHEVRAWLEERERPYAVRWSPRPTPFLSVDARRRLNSSSGGWARMRTRRSFLPGTQARGVPGSGRASSFPRIRRSVWAGGSWSAAAPTIPTTSPSTRPTAPRIRR